MAAHISVVSDWFTGHCTRQQLAIPICCVRVVPLPCWKKAHVLSWLDRLLQKVSECVSHTSASFMVSENNPSSIHSTSHNKLTPCNDILCTPLLPFTMAVHITTQIKPSYTAKQNKCGVYIGSIQPLMITSDLAPILSSFPSVSMSSTCPTSGIWNLYVDL